MTARKNNRFVPTLEGLEAREVASANPVTRPVALLHHAHLRPFQTGPRVVHDARVRQGRARARPAGARRGPASPAPLTNSPRTYVGLKDLRKGDIPLNTTAALASDFIKEFSNSNYNHAAIYIGNGKVVD